MAKQKKIKVIREIPSKVKEIEKKGEEEVEEEGLEEEVEFVGEEPLVGEEFSDFVSSRAPVLEAVPAEPSPDLESEVESTPVTPITEQADKEGPGETDYITGYETKYEGTETEETVPIIGRMTREMRERGMFIREEERGEIRPRAVMIEPDVEMRRIRRRPRDIVIEAERRAEEDKLPFERKYKEKRKL